MSGVLGPSVWINACLINKGCVVEEQVERWETWLHGRGKGRGGKGRDPYVAACTHCTKLTVSVFDLAKGNSSPMGFIELITRQQFNSLGNYEILMELETSWFDSGLTFWFGASAANVPMILQSKCQVTGSLRLFCLVRYEGQLSDYSWLKLFQRPKNI